MVLDLTSLFENEGEEALFSHSVDLAAFLTDGPLKAPASVRGRAANTAGVLTVSYTAEYTIDTVCDRCLDPAVKPRSLKAEHIAVRRLEGEDDGSDDYLVLPDAQLNVDEMVYADIVLDLPAKILCREDCRGLCPVCGINLNRETCACRTTPADPRLQALRDLL